VFQKDKFILRYFLTGRNLDEQNGMVESYACKVDLVSACYQIGNWSWVWVGGNWLMIIVGLF